MNKYHDNVFRVILVISTTLLFPGVITGAGQHPWGPGDWHHPELKDYQVEVPPVDGHYYQAEIPDSLELSERAALAINALTRLLNPEYDYAQYTHVDLRHDPPWMMMEAGITNLNPKWIESLPLMRIMSGSVQNTDVDPHLVESLIHNIGFDGLTYQPPDHPGAFYEDFSREQNLPASNIFGEGRQLLALAVLSELYPDPIYRYAAEIKIQRLLDIAVAKGDGLYFRRTQGYTPGEKDTDKIDIVAVTDHEMKDSSFGMVGTAVAHSVSPVAMGAARYYHVTGYPPALELARGMTNYFRKEARLIEESGRWHGYHFHIITTGILGQAEYGLATGDEDTLEWVKRAYEYGRSIGDPTTGFFAGVPGCGDTCKYNPNAEECGKTANGINVEPCIVSDMSILALMLSRAGMGDYYEDVEHYVRNFLTESQVTNLDYIENFPTEISQGEQMKGQFNATLGKYRDLRKVSYNNVAERAVGSFCGTNPNQWYQGAPGPFLVGCCLGNGARALYYVWDSILQQEGKDIRVNLLLNRASPWADLDSYLPYEAKVVLKMKKAENAYIRIPGWTNRAKVTCSVDGKDKYFEWRGNYIFIESLNAGSEVTIEFPMVEKTLYRNYKSNEFILKLRGFTVVDLKPHEDITPIFRRSHYEKSPAPKRVLQRFSTSGNITW